MRQGRRKRFSPLRSLAFANAVFNATGRRIRDLPIRAEMLL
jgi:hypothetical protein